MGLHPLWKTPSGKATEAARLAKRFQNVNLDAQGRPNTIFLKATVLDGETGRRRIVGVAIWAQLSYVPGHGNPPNTELAITEDMGYPNEREERFAKQLFAGLNSKRAEVLREKAETDSPAALVLDLCAVDTDFQRRGIAVKLVQWGLDEAERRGGLEATTEASVMGRWVYGKLGFKPVGEIDYGVDEELLGSRKLPSNLFMRTKP